MVIVMRSVTDIWDSAKELLRARLNSVCYKNWVADLKPLSYEDNKLVLVADNAVTCNTLINMYSKDFVEILSSVCGTDCTPVFITPERVAEFVGQSDVSFLFPALNPKYTFDTFVVGESNRFAHAACVAVANNPASAYNPLFMYGGVGLGKTHLMHAIGHVAYQNNPNVRIVYVTCEEFTNELISAMREGKEGKTAEFKKKYRDVDILMVDDIQFLSGKTQTQSEFFHTFNALYSANKQIILTSDRPAHEIPTLEDRLYSRFECGLVADINQPDFETRAAILKQRADNDGLDVSDEVLYFIASKVKSNIRELEGALNRVTAYARFSETKITVKLADKVLCDILQRSGSRRLTAEIIIQAVSDYYEVPVDEILGKKREKKIVSARQMAMYTCRKLTEMSFEEIGNAFGGKHYSTVMHACEILGNDMQSMPDGEARVGFDDIKSRLTAN